VQLVPLFAFHVTAVHPVTHFYVSVDWLDRLTPLELLSLLDRERLILGQVLDVDAWVVRIHATTTQIHTRGGWLVSVSGCHRWMNTPPEIRAIPWTP